jgi:hypothetical protein
MDFGYPWNNRTMLNFYIMNSSQSETSVLSVKSNNDFLRCKRKCWARYPIERRWLLFLYDCLKICKVFLRK